MEAYPKPRHHYIYTPRYGQRGFLSYAGQRPNGAYPAGFLPGYGYGYGYGGVGTGYAGNGGGYYPGVYGPNNYYAHTYPYHYPLHHQYSTPATSYFNYRVYGPLYPLANFYSPYQRSYYTSMPSYGYQTAYVYPPSPGPSTTTTTTTYHVTNSQVPAPSSPFPTPRTTTHVHATGPSSRADMQLENRRVATQRGAYHPRRIRPADARNDDPFWCRERNGEWHLRTYYQIENECYPGRWLMDAEVGFLVFHRE